MTKICVYCEGMYCGHWCDVDLDGLGLPHDIAIIPILEHRRFICTRCGSRKVSIRSVWPTAQGATRQPEGSPCWAAEPSRKLND